MEKEINEVAEMQRKRLKQVIDPMHSLMAADHSGYSDYLLTKLNEHGYYHKTGNLQLNVVPWLAGSCIPLSYYTKSIFFPMLYFISSFSYLLYREVSTSDCFFCRPTLRELTYTDMQGQ